MSNNKNARAIFILVHYHPFIVNVTICHADQPTEIGRRHPEWRGDRRCEIFAAGFVHHLSQTSVDILQQNSYAVVELPNFGAITRTVSAAGSLSGHLRQAGNIGSHKTSVLMLASTRANTAAIASEEQHTLVADFSFRLLFIATVDIRSPMRNRLWACRNYSTSGFRTRVPPLIGLGRGTSVAEGDHGHLIVQSLQICGHSPRFCSFVNDILGTIHTCLGAELKRRSLMLYIFSA
ncbi:uncharacterized protein ARMOST_16783 [Armillaria ostoyae]|uniref:Uncharacterized protein n=1 Tax=Armillaria ostoyae TaxID=47428 RepID=A0A284RX75_ARMOS|nr:uncharacterized protein ARMOST_16783 [Armillaria ostoyae]